MDMLLNGVLVVSQSIGICFAVAIFVYVCARLVVAAYFRSRKQFK